MGENKRGGEGVETVKREGERRGKRWGKGSWVMKAGGNQGRHRTRGERVHPTAASMPS
jgi:hypothetical protein